MRRIIALIALLFGFCVLACPVPYPDDYEGDEPNECADGEDNDENGLTDCEDPTCFGAENCLEDDNSADDDSAQ